MGILKIGIRISISSQMVLKNVQATMIRGVLGTLRDREWSSPFLSLIACRCVVCGCMPMGNANATITHPMLQNPESV